MSSRIAVTLVVASATALPPATHAQVPIPLGDQVLANVTIALDQDENAIALGADGSFVVAWRDESGDGDSSSIVARRFHLATGDPLSGEVQVNTTTLGDQRAPSVAVRDDGLTFVAWEGRDASSTGIFGALLDADGEPVPGGGEIEVNTTTSAAQRRPVVAFAPGGEALVAWEDHSTPHARIRGRIYPADFPASPPSAEIQINQLVPLGDQEEPAVVGDPSGGGWLVAWHGVVELPDRPARRAGSPVAAVMLRRLDGTGGGPAESLLSVDLDLGPRGHVALAVNASGEGIAVWEGLDLAGTGIYGREFLDGSPILSELAITLLTDVDERAPTVTIDQEGAFVAAWLRVEPGFLRPGDGGPEVVLGSPIVIKGRKSGRSGAAAAELGAGNEEFQVNSSGTWLERPRIAGEPRGNFVVAWSGEDDPDPDESGVYFQRFSASIFVDGFEIGDTAAWSLSIP